MSTNELSKLGESRLDKVEKVEAYRCKYCGKLYHTEELATLCHSDRTCKVCGDVIGKLSYHALCEECRVESQIKREQDKCDRAIKMTYDEYMRLYPNNPVVMGDDDFYFDDLDSLFESYEDATWAWSAEERLITLDPNMVLDRFEEEIELDDFEVSKEAMDKIRAFCKEWNKHHSQTVYYKDERMVVILPSKEE